MRKRILVLLTVVLLSGCNLTDSDAVKFVKSAIKGDIEHVWKYTSDDALDETLTDSEKRDSFKKFSEKWPKSLPYSLRDLNDIIQHNPKIDEIGSKKEDNKTIYALTATYQGNQGYSYGEAEIAKVVKFIVEINNKSGLVVDVDFDKVIERNEISTSKNRSREAKKLYVEYKKDKSGNKSNIRKILKMYPDYSTPIEELNNDIKLVQTKIKSKLYNQLVKEVKVGGWSEKGKFKGASSGYGMKLNNYVKLENLTDIPIKVSHEFDLQKHSSWEEEYCIMLSCGHKKYHSEWNNYNEGETGYLKLHAKEVDAANKSYDNINYYNGYRVTQQFSDGTSRYKYDDTKSFRANSYKITKIIIWSK